LPHHREVIVSTSYDKQGKKVGHLVDRFVIMS